MTKEVKDYSCFGCKHLKSDKAVFPSLYCMLGNPMLETRCDEYEAKTDERPDKPAMEE